MTETIPFRRGTCYGCCEDFNYDPRWTPHLLVDPVTNVPAGLLARSDGGPEFPAADMSRARSVPVCPRCCEDVNGDRAGLGLPPLPVADSLGGRSG